MMPLAHNVGISRRVIAYHAFFGLCAVVWLVLGGLYVSNAVVSSRIESSCLIHLGRAAAAVSVELARGQNQLQPIVDRIRGESSLAYCAVVSPESKLLAYSGSEPAGDAWRATPAGEGVVKQRRQLADGQRVCDFAMPLWLGERRAGTLHLAVNEPSLGQLGAAAAQHAHLAFIGPLLCVAAGALVIGRVVNPLMGVESQLKRLAAAPSLTSLELKPVSVRGAACLGWNRLVEERDASPEEQEALPERVNRAVRVDAHNPLAEALQSLGDGLAVADADGLVAFANRAAAALLRRDDPQQLHGQRLEEIVAEAWGCPPDHPLLDHRNGGRPVTCELEHAEDDSLPILRVARHPLRPPQSGFVWTFRDVTQQRMADRARTQFVHTATHELRTPLANIKAHAETLALADIADPEEQKKFLNTINSEATRLARFVDDLLSVSSMEVGSLSITKRETEVLRLLRGVVEKVRPELEQKGVKLEVSLPPKAAHAQWDKDKVAAALVNLLGNAAKYTPAGGRVALRASEKNGQLQVSVEDSGIGISESELPKICEKFFRSSDPRVQSETGTGLGLALTREIVRLHGGRMRIQSRLNQGTSVALLLPLA